ncbi:MAG: hypothetical protein NTZ02_04000 [Candidatus Woesearchaeota archaeon]|nr:hypothetical protein [Candidatus Woesearchaeota archaeon]
MANLLRGRIKFAAALIVAILIVGIIFIFLLPILLFWIIAGLVLFLISLAIGFFSMFHAKRRQKKQIDIPKSRVKIKDL